MTRTPTAILVLILSAASVVSGCAATRSTPRSAAAVPERFSASGGQALPDRWWTTLEDPALADLIERALEGNPGLRIAWDRVAQAEAVARKAGAALLPTLDATASGSRSVARNTVGSPAGDRTETSYVTGLSMGLAASWEIDAFGRIAAGRDAAALDVAAREKDVRAAAVTLSAEIASTWYQLVEQVEQNRLLAAQIRTNEQVLELVTLRFTQGRVGAADVLQQRQLVEARRGDMVQAQRSAEVLEIRLNVLVGLTPDAAAPEPAGGLIDLPPLPATGVPAELVERRPDLRSAWDAVLAADLRVAEALADRYPRLSLTARTQLSGDELANPFRNWLATIAGNLTAPLLDGDRREAEIERTRAVVSLALNEYERVLLNALGEVETALVREARQRELLASLDTQLGLSRQITVQTRENYGNGAEDYLRVLSALATEQALERTLLTARRSLIEDRIDLCRALAGGWELDRPALRTGGKEAQ